MITLTNDADLKDYILVIPSVAVGNVGQLAVDLLISNLNLQSIGYVTSSAFIPIVGLDPYNEQSNKLCTAIEIYSNIEKKIVVLQIRSLLVKNPIEFFRELRLFVAEQKIAKVVILTSSYAHERHPNQLQVSSFRYIGSEDLIAEDSELFENLHWIKHESNPMRNDDLRNGISISGGGFAGSLHKFLTIANIPSIVLFKFCSEGNNIPDALGLISYLNQWLKLIESDSTDASSMTYPPSWKYLFGNPPPTEIY